MTIAKQLKIKDFPFEIKDKNGNQIYFEDSYGYWGKWEYDSNRNLIYFEDYDGDIIDDRPKYCENKIVEIDGIKYKLTKV